MKTLSRPRRDFLKVAGLGALSWASAPWLPNRGLGRPVAVELGRATRTIQAYEEPSFSGAQLRLVGTDSVVSIYEKTVGDAGTTHNAIWLRVDAGWVHSAYVQPVRDELNKPVLQVSPKGFLAEVTVPYTQAWRNDTGKPEASYRFYYGSTYWVDGVVSDSRDQVWYRIVDDRYGVRYFVLAPHLRPVAPEEFTPLAPDAIDKHIEVDLRQQRLTAHEAGRLVYAAKLSSGRPGVETPTGQFRIERKRPTRHMAASDAGGNGFDLPGVPWVSYFSWTGVAFHGTYWHNGYGHPRSRGCVNLTPADAKWIYRWTLPRAPAGETYVSGKEGTQVVVFE